MEVLLVGHGSVGKKHLDNLFKLMPVVHILEPKFDDVFDTNPNIRHFYDIQSLSKFLEQKNQTDESDEKIAIVSNWGPDHLETTTKLVSLGYKKILVEKPLASSLNQLEVYENLLSRGVQIWCNYHLRYSKGVATIRDFQKKHNIGSPHSISVTGGAKCLATTGIHWIDFAINLFDEDPSQIYGNIVNQYINPRNKELSFLEGIAFFRFAPNKTLLMNFHNSSQSDAIITVLWQHYSAEIRSGNIMFFNSKNTGSETLPNTRTMSFDNLLEEQNFFDEGFEALFYAFINATSSQYKVLHANRALLLALCSSKLNKSIGWDEEIAGELKMKDWRIS